MKVQAAGPLAASIVLTGGEKANFEKMYCAQLCDATPDAHISPPIANFCVWLLRHGC